MCLHHQHRQQRVGVAGGTGNSNATVSRGCLCSPTSLLVLLPVFWLTLLLLLLLPLLCSCAACIAPADRACTAHTPVAAPANAPKGHIPPVPLASTPPPLSHFVRCVQGGIPNAWGYSMGPGAYMSNLQNLTCHACGLTGALFSSWWYNLKWLSLSGRQAAAAPTGATARRETPPPRHARDVARI